MTSPITANIGAATAGLARTATPANAPQAVQTPQTPGQVAQVSQAASQRTATKVEPDDRKRGVQVPKRAEGVFAPQRTKKKPGQKASVEEQEKNLTRQDMGDSLDIKA